MDEHKPSFHTTTQTKDQMKIAHKDREKSALHPCINIYGRQQSFGLIPSIFWVQRAQMRPIWATRVLISSTAQYFAFKVCWWHDFSHKSDLTTMLLLGLTKICSKTSPKSQLSVMIFEGKDNDHLWVFSQSIAIGITTISKQNIHSQGFIAMVSNLARLVRSITCQNTFPHRRLWKKIPACNRPLVTKCNQMSCNNVKFSSLEMKNDVFWSVTCNRGV